MPTAIIVLREDLHGREYEHTSIEVPVVEIKFASDSLEISDDHSILLDDIAQIWVDHKLIWHDNSPDCPVCGRFSDHLSERMADYAAVEARLKAALKRMEMERETEEMEAIGPVEFFLEQKRLIKILLAFDLAGASIMVYLMLVIFVWTQNTLIFTLITIPVLWGYLAFHKYLDKKRHPFKEVMEGLRHG